MAAESQKTACADDASTTQSVLDALNAAQATIQFDLGGHVVSANENFLLALGYELDEIVGEHHRMFCDSDYAASPEYSAFWAALAKGERKADVFRRLTKDGGEIWINASYNPIHNAAGELVGVVKFATDVTAQVAQDALFKSKVEAINGAQAVIEFDTLGNIQSANANFLAATGYELDEIVGQHHRIFCEPDYAASAEYEAFWKSLASGERKADVFKRITKSGDELWINASYNPVLNGAGELVGVVKFATDVTAQVAQDALAKSKVEAINGAQAVIEFDTLGNIRSANANFLAATGYDLDEIVGQHHRMFCEPEYAASAEYDAFWKSLGSTYSMPTKIFLPLWATRSRTSRANTTGCSAIRNTPPVRITARCGTSCVPVSTPLVCSGVWIAVARMSGSMPPTTRCSGRKATLSRS